MVEVAQKGAVQRVAIRGEGGKLNGVHGTNPYRRILVCLTFG